MLIQILLVIGVIAIGVFFMRRTGADSHLAIRRLVFAVFVIGAVGSILFPQWLTWVANLIGVGRGTDLLLYAFVMMFLVFVYTQSRRNAAQQGRITLLARHLALLEAQVEGEAGDVGVRADPPVSDET